MFRLALAAAVIYLVGYGFAVQRFAWVGWLEPRGGIIGFAFYLILATGLIGYGDRQHRRKEEVFYSARWNHRPSTGFEAILAGWILLLMPPIWWFASSTQS